MNTDIINSIYKEGKNFMLFFLTDWNQELLS